MTSINLSLQAGKTPRATRSIQRILDAAAKMFGSTGYQGASMEAVARAAGVSKGLLHYHFNSKEHLLIEAQRATFTQIYDRFTQRFQHGERGLDTALDAIDSLWEALYEMRNWSPFMVEVLSLAAQQQRVRHQVDDFYSETMEMLEEGMSRVFSDHTERLLMPPVRLARVIRSSLHGLVLELSLCRGQEDLDQVKQTYRDLRMTFENAILCPHPSQPEVP
jgi:AcrR family transcriptional regulator